MNNGNQLKIGAILSYIQILIGAITTLVCTPLILNLLGQNEYGLYNTVASTIAMLSVLSLGFNSGYIRYYSKYKQSDDHESIYKLNGLFLIIFVIIGIIAFACGIFFSFHLELFFSDGLTSSEYKTAKTLMILLACNLAISFPMSVFTSIISANEKFVFLKILSIIKTLFSPIISLVVLLMGFKSIGMVIGALTLAVIIDIVYIYYVKNTLNNKFVFHEFEKGIFLSLFSYTAFIALNMIVDQINWNVDKILLARYRGTDAVAIYSVGYTLYQQYMVFSTAISSVFTPRIHRLVNMTQGDATLQRQMLSNLFVKVGRIQFMLLGLIASGFVIFGKYFLAFWAGDGYEESYYVALLLILPASIALIQNIGIEIQRALNRHKFRSLCYLVMAMFNLILSIFLCQRHGATGAAVGTAISLILANGLAINIYYYARCNIDIFLFWRNILKEVPGLIPPITIGCIMNYLSAYNSISAFFVCIVLYTMMYCISVYFISMNAMEKMLVKNFVKKLVSRKNLGIY